MHFYEIRTTVLSPESFESTAKNSELYTATKAGACYTVEFTFFQCNAKLPFIKVICLSFTLKVRNLQ